MLGVCLCFAIDIIFLLMNINSICIKGNNVISAKQISSWVLVKVSRFKKLNSGVPENSDVPITFDKNTKPKIEQIVIELNTASLYLLNGIASFNITNIELNVAIKIIIVSISFIVKELLANRYKGIINISADNP